MYLSFRLSSIGLDAGNGTAKLFCKSGQPASIPFDQFLRCLFGSHGQAVSGIRRPTGVSVTYPCTNQCSRPSVDLKDTFPNIGDKEIQVSRVPDLLALISQSQNPSVSFNQAVLTLSGPRGGRILQLFMKMQITQEPLHQETWDPLFLSLGLLKKCQIMSYPRILAPTAARNNFLLAARKFL